MLVSRERRPAIRTLRGWAISVLQEAGAIRECEEHGWMQDRADPHARKRAFDIARRQPPKECPRRRRSLRSPKFSTASATPVPSAPRTSPVSLVSIFPNRFHLLRAADIFR
jgi:hypothetical protein